MKKFALAGLMVLGLGSAAFAAAHGGPTMMMDTDAGSVLTDNQGMTLYIFDKDAPGVSNCYDACAVNWPPFIAADGAAATGDLTLVERTDGTMQWAYGGMPLYYWKNDMAPGDTTGDGVNDVWHVVTGE